MVPEILGATPWKLFWWLGALVGSALNLVVLRRRGVDPARAAVALAIAGTAAFFGARLEWMIENDVALREVLSVPGARMPGGLIAFVLVLPPLLRLLGLPVRRFADAITPGAALAIAVGRLGCFLQGCCFGTRTDLPWGVRFPAGSPAYESHRILGWLPPDATSSLAVHPLELYFAVTALAIMAVMVRLLPRVRWDGQAFLVFLALHSGAKFGLEHLRGREFGAAANAAGSVEIWIAVAATLALVAVGLGRSAARTVAPIGADAEPAP